MANYLTPELIKVSEFGYREFIQKLPELAHLSPDISILRQDAIFEKVASVGNLSFQKEIGEIKAALANPEVGIIAADIAESSELSADENAYWGVVVALALGSNIFKPAKDEANKTPYTVYAASYEKSKALVDFGLDTIAPETKLGFHTDGTINKSRVFMPYNIMLYNIVIEYKKPGNFYWVPFALWTEKKQFMDRIGIGKRYRIKVTPSVYEFSKEKIENFSPLEIEAPIFVKNAEHDYPLYINGNVFGICEDDAFDPAVIDALKESISQNKIRYAVPQKSRRAIFACNLKGAHARDIFEEPLYDVPYTRIFMRSVDTKTIDLNG
jgi:hypothetical protein